MYVQLSSTGGTLTFVPAWNGYYFTTPSTSTRNSIIWLTTVSGLSATSVSPNQVYYLYSFPLQSYLQLVPGENSSNTIINQTHLIASSLPSAFIQTAPSHWKVITNGRETIVNATTTFITNLCACPGETFASQMEYNSFPQCKCGSGQDCLAGISTNKCVNTPYTSTTVYSAAEGPCASNPCSTGTCTEDKLAALGYRCVTNEGNGTNWPLIVGIVIAVIILIAIIGVILYLLMKKKKKTGKGVEEMNSSNEQGSIDDNEVVWEEREEVNSLYVED